jgi:hypothetical protein
VADDVVQISDLMTTTIQIVGFAFFFSGLAIALCGTIAMLFWRKSEVSKLELFWEGSRAAAHPEYYVRSEHVKTVKMLHLVGISLFLTGVLALLFC